MKKDMATDTKDFNDNGNENFIVCFEGLKIIFAFN